MRCECIKLVVKKYTIRMKTHSFSRFNCKMLLIILIFFSFNVGKMQKRNHQIIHNKWNKLKRLQHRLMLFHDKKKWCTSKCTRKNLNGLLNKVGLKGILTFRIHTCMHFEISPYVLLLCSLCSLFISFFLNLAHYKYSFGFIFF